ncbi:MAG: aminotransferase class V-fold PLP-dependent enzyme [Oscillospiraceae bacterium]|nr:aminotransferase class V-fold PLP-dependent enzyme [Oscillospiraceae bacterium]
MIYFDNAATSFPKPQIIKNKIQDIFTKYGGNPGRSGHKMSIETALMVYKTREAVANFFGAHDVEDVIFCLNCTMAINIVIKGLLKQGDHVVISSYEHNAVLRPIYKLYQLGIITYDIAEVFENNTEKTLESFRKLIKKNTKLVISTHGSNVFGNILPIKEISDIAHENNALFLVDAAQSAGIIDINIKNINIDFLCVPGHKSLYGLSGTGILITNQADKLSTIIEGGTGSVSQNFSQPEFLPDKLESGTGNTIGILSLYYGLKFINNKGLDNIYRHEIKILQYIYSRLIKNKNIILYTEFPKIGTHLPVLSFNINNINCDNIIKLLNKKNFALRGGLHCSPLAHKTKNTLETGTSRISIGVFNNLNQAKQLCDEILKI